jgi:hypothetical protein
MGDTVDTYTYSELKFVKVILEGKPTCPCIEIFPLRKIISYFGVHHLLVPYHWSELSPEPVILRPSTYLLQKFSGHVLALYNRKKILLKER